MLVEKNSSTKIIENRMNFKFEELELVGKCDKSINERLIYKYNNNIKNYKVFNFFLVNFNHKHYRLLHYMPIPRQQ